MFTYGVYVPIRFSVSYHITFPNIPKNSDILSERKYNISSQNDPNLCVVCHIKKITSNS